MSSPQPGFPGEDFFHPGFTPAGSSPQPELPSLQEAQGPQKPQKLITRRPVPPPQQSSLATAATANAKTTGLGLGLGADADTGTGTWTGTGTLVGTVTDIGTVSPAAGRRIASKTADSYSAVPRAPGGDDVSSASSVYGQSALPSASPSHPSPPPSWPASPHVQQDRLSSQLHGVWPPMPSQPVSPLSDSENFSSTHASRANSLAHRVSQRGSRSAEAKDARKNAPLPPLPGEFQHPSAFQEDGVKDLESGFHTPAVPPGQRPETTTLQGAPAMSALEHGAHSEEWPLGTLPSERQTSPDVNPPVEQHADVAPVPEQETQSQSQTLQLSLQGEEGSPAHETPLARAPVYSEIFSPQGSIPPVYFSPHVTSQQQQHFLPQRTSQQPFSPYLASRQLPQQHQRLSQPRTPTHPFSPGPASIQGMPAAHRRTSSQLALHPLQQHPTVVPQRMSIGSEGGATPFMQYEDASVFGPTTETSAAKEEGLLGRDGLVGVEGVGSRRLSAQSRTGAASAHSLWGGYRASWLPEILWCLLAVACLGIIGVLLSRYDGHSLNNWPLPITLNTLVAFLTSICHAALLFPVLEGLGQLKWNWFARKDRPLSDFQAFEDARRGPYGVVRLALLTKGRNLSVIAAIVLITSIVTSPLTQIMIEYPTRLATGSNPASVFKSESYPYTSNTAAGTSSADLDTRQKQSIQQGIYNPADTPMTPLPPNCGSKECQFQQFSSLAVCAQAEDVTGLLRVSDRIRVDTLPINLNLPDTAFVRNASLSNGVYLLGSSNTYNLNMSTPASARNGEKPQPGAGTLSFKQQPNLMATAISNFFVIYTNHTRQLSSSTLPSNDDGDDANKDDDEIPVSYRAVEVLLHFCVGTYEVTMDQSANGLPQTVRTSTSIDVTASSAPPSDQQQQQPLLLASRADGTARNYTIDMASVRPLADYMASTFSGAFSASMGARAVGYTATGDAIGSTMFRSPQPPGESVDEPMRQTVWNITQNVATSLTNTIRSMGVSQAGQALETETFVSVRWGWLAVLATQVLLSATFLLGVAVQTTFAEVRVLKASGGLATMLAVSAEDRQVLEREGIGRLDEGRIMADRFDEDGIRGRFTDDGDRGWAMDLGVRIEEAKRAAG